jgi:hypothetical protein
MGNQVFWAVPLLWEVIVQLRAIVGASQLGSNELKTDDDMIEEPKKSGNIRGKTSAGDVLRDLFCRDVLWTS